MSARADDGQFKKKLTCVVMNNKQKFCEVSTRLHMVRAWAQADLAVVCCRLSFPIITRLRAFLNWSIVYCDVCHTQNVRVLKVMIAIRLEKKRGNSHDRLFLGLVLQCFGRTFFFFLSSFLFVCLFNCLFTCLFCL